jgi:hypothetical protein
LNIDHADTPLKEIEAIRSSQKKLCLWLYEEGCISWSRIHKACQSIVDSLSEDTKHYFGNYPEYKIFVPLLKNGSIEVCRKENCATLLYCMNSDLKIGNDDFQSVRSPPALENKAVFNPLEFLKTYPSIKTQIETFSRVDIERNLFKVYMNLYDYSYSQCKGIPYSTGIYKTADIVWYTPYLLDARNIVRRISGNDENPDALNLARLYVRIINPACKKPLFEYNVQTKDLTCFCYSELPVLLVRALLLFTPAQITKTQFCLPYPNIPFKNIGRETVVEIQRIFSKNSVKIL